MPVGTVYKARFLFTANDQVAFMVRHLLVSAFTGTEATPTQIATYMDGIIATAFKGSIANTATYRGVGVQKLFPAPTGIEGTTIASLGVGTAGATLMPRQVSGLITLRTANAGRKYRGRMYVPFPATAFDDTNGIPTAGYVTQLGLWNSAFGAAVWSAPGGGGGTTTLQNIIFHRATNTYDLITTTVIQQKWATQRRRGSYGRTNVAPF